METTLNKSSVVWNSDLGEFINDKHAHLAQVLQDYKPTFSLVYIPKKDRDATDVKPWAILDSPANKPTHIIRYLSDKEMENPEAILQWVFEGDLDKHRPDDVFARMELKRAAEELLNLKKQEEDMADFYDKIEFAAKTNLHTWKHDGRTYQG
jgi:hypothetical protein